MRKFCEAEDLRGVWRKATYDYRNSIYYKIPCDKLENDTSLTTLTGHKVFRTLIRAKISPCSTGHKYVYSGSYDGRVNIFDI